MEILNSLKQALKAASETIRWGAGLQETTRKALITDLQAICANCDKAYDAVLTRLVPIKNNFQNPAQLASELRTFASDANTRQEFKPEHLCGQVDQLLTRLSSNLDPLKYSIDVRRINELRNSLSQFGNVDAAIFASYDNFTHELDNLATQLQSGQFDPAERAQYAQHVIEVFEAELRSAQSSMREAKSSVVGLI